MSRRSLKEVPFTLLFFFKYLEAFSFPSLKRSAGWTLKWITRVNGNCHDCLPNWRSYFKQKYNFELASNFWTVLHFLTQVTISVRYATMHGKTATNIKDYFPHGHVVEKGNKSMIIIIRNELTSFSLPTLTPRNRFASFTMNTRKFSEEVRWYFPEFNLLVRSMNVPPKNVNEIHTSRQELYFKYFLQCPSSIAFVLWTIESICTKENKSFSITSRCPSFIHFFLRFWEVSQCDEFLEFRK